MEKLLGLASPPLAATPSDGIRGMSGRLGSDLYDLLRRANGFYAFESALHVFPSRTSDRMSIELWNDPDLWRQEYADLAEGLVFFAEDVFGGQFVLSDAGVGAFDPETGDITPIGSDLVTWATALLGDHEVLTGYPLGHEWQRRNGPLPEGQRLLPKIPFVTGGAFEIDNLYAADAVEGMKARGNLAMQMRDLPDGAKITYRIVE
jgi:hypothetical protein